MMTAMDKVFGVLESASWAFVGGVEADQLPSSKAGCAALARDHGEDWLCFRRVSAPASQAQDFFARNYEEIFLPSEEVEKGGNALVLKHEWSIPNAECKWDMYGHLMQTPCNVSSGCVVRTGYDLSTDFGLGCLKSGLADGTVFFSRDFC